MRIEGLQGQTPAFGDVYDDGQSSGVTGFFRDGGDRLADHLPRDGIDGRGPGRLVQSGTGHAADAFSAVDRDALARSGHRGVDQDAVRDVRVVAAVFLDRAAAARIRCRRIAHVQREKRPLRCAKFHRSGEHAGQQRLRGGLRGCCGTAAGGVAAPEHLSADESLAGHEHHPFFRMQGKKYGRDHGHGSGRDADRRADRYPGIIYPYIVT